MIKEQQMVREFHNFFNLTRCDIPTLPSKGSDLPTIRANLIREEADELYSAMCFKSLENIAKEIADLLYVTLGTAVSFGIDIEPIFEAVHQSNMSKVNGYLNEDGKWVKPNTYTPPDLKPILAKQMKGKSNDKEKRC